MEADENRMAGSFQKQGSTQGPGCLYPVVLRVPDHLWRLRGRPQVAILSRLARVAVRLSARLTGVAPPACEKNDIGAPQPQNGTHWSVTHKPRIVAGVVAGVPVGIDIETVRSPTEALYRRIATGAEWRLGHEDPPPPPHFFYRVWTAKEAVLKAEGVGLRGLSRCRVTAIPDQATMQLAFDRRTWTVVHHFLDTHVLALTCSGSPVEWRCDAGVFTGA